MNGDNNNSKIKDKITANHLNQTILATDIPLTYSESDLFTIFSRYGTVNKIQKLSNLSCCLIEFGDNVASTALIKMSKYNPFYIGTHKIHLELSSQPINTDNSTNVLSVNISNAKYPITVDIIKQICDKFGKLIRIFIGRKSRDNFIECLVEFDKISEAKSAKESLNGEDIYSGCCSLDVKYSRISIVPVLKNDSESWDFSKSPLKTGILQSPPSPMIDNNDQSIKINKNKNCLDLINNNNNNNIVYNNNNIFIDNNINNINTNICLSPVATVSHETAPPVYNYPSLYSYPPPLFARISNRFPCRLPIPLPIGYSMLGCHNNKRKLSDESFFISESGAVFVANNLTLNIGVDHLFNLFCLYGNVSRIRFLVTQLGCAMVQMGSRASAELCVRYYNNQLLFGQPMRLAWSHWPNIDNTQFTSEFLPNGSVVFRDFSTDANNRFLNDQSAVVGNNQNNRTPAEPNRSLHFFNGPHTFMERDLIDLVAHSGVPLPINVIRFNSRNDRSKKCVGLMEFLRLEDALIALSVLNHKPIILPDSNGVFHIKLTFSAREPKSAIDNQPGETDSKRLKLSDKEKEN